MAALLSNSTRVAFRSGASASAKAGAAGLTFARGKATLPDLPCKFDCLGVSIHDPEETTYQDQPANQ